MNELYYDCDDETTGERTADNVSDSHLVLFVQIRCSGASLPGFCWRLALSACSVTFLLLCCLFTHIHSHIFTYSQIHIFDFRRDSTGTHGC